MADRLDSLRRVGDFSRAELANRSMSEESIAPTDRSYPIFQSRRALAQLRTGQPAGAVGVVRTTLDTLRSLYREGGPPPLITTRLQLILGLGHLRTAVDSSCLSGADPAWCTLPPQASGPAPGSSSADSAAEVYRARMESGDGDAMDAWLLNVATMMTGGFPDAVRSEWRVPPSAFEAEGQLGRFRDAAPGLGVDVKGLAGGAVLEDFDGDGDLDLMVCSQGAEDQLRYFENLGDGTFEERTEAAGLEGLTAGRNLKQADYDNDGDVDVLVLRGGWLTSGVPNSLLRNDGDGRFVDVTEEAGLLRYHPTQTAAWADYDGDGDLDLYVGNETRSSHLLSHPSSLYRNEGDGTFEEVAAAAGVDVEGFVKGVDWGDVDGDGRPDLYVSVLGEPNRLFRNRGPGDEGWGFEDVAAAAGVREPERSFSTWFFDYDNDGHQDLYVSAWGMTPVEVGRSLLTGVDSVHFPRLYHNDGDGTFTDVTEEASLDHTVMSMGNNFGDLDGDGYPDVLLGTGNPDMRSLFATRVFRNDGGERFLDVTAAGGFGHLGKGHGVAVGDVDADGDQDAYVVYGGAYEGDVFRNALYENPGHGHRWLTLRLVGEEANASGVGARIRVVVTTPDGGERTVHVTAGTGSSFGASSLQQEIGLGEAEAVRSVRIRWPGSGTVDTYRDVSMDRVYRAREGADRLEPVASEPMDLADSPGGPGAGESGGSR